MNFVVLFKWSNSNKLNAIPQTGESLEDVINKAESSCRSMGISPDDMMVLTLSEAKELAAEIEMAIECGSLNSLKTA